jgi:hypothetical protein
MEGGLLVWIGFGWWAVASTVQWASAALGRKSRTAAAVHHRPLTFSIVAPLNGAADASAAYIAALRALSEQGAEVLICIADGEGRRTRRCAISMAGGAGPGWPRHHLQSQDEQRAQGTRGRRAGRSWRFAMPASC